MFSKFLKNLSILKKFLFINLLIFIIIFALTILYLKAIQPNLINKKTSNHIQIINNTIDHIKRLKINFTEDDIRKFLFSTRFLFQNLDRVILYDNEFNLIGDTNTLDLDPRSFSQRLDKIEMDELNKNSENVKIIKKKIVDKNKTSLSEIIIKRKIDIVLFYLCNLQCCNAVVEDNVSKTVTQIFDSIKVAKKLDIKILFGGEGLFLLDDIKGKIDNSFLTYNDLKKLI